MNAAHAYEMAGANVDTKVARERFRRALCMKALRRVPEQKSKESCAEASICEAAGNVHLRIGKGI